jgi:hypothetical protein
MDGQPDIVSFEPRRRPEWARRLASGRIAIVVFGLACLAVIGYLTVLVAHQDGTIARLRAAPAESPAPAGSPSILGSTMFPLPTAAGGSFSVVVVTVSPQPNAAPVTWLFIYGKHAEPGQRYGLIADTCHGQYVSSSDLADAVADGQGDLTIVTPGMAISPASGNVWFMLYRWRDGAPLGGIQGPLIGGNTRIFRTGPRC